MTVAMMLPSASPTVLLLYGRVVRQSQRKGQVAHASGAVATFAAGYLTFVALQWALEQYGAMTGMMTLRQLVIAGTCSSRSASIN
jgi:predicted metal-binding membrane protein